MEATRPLFWFRGGTPPTTPPGGSAPWTPRLPTPVGRGFASVLGPTRGGVARAGYSPLILVLWGGPPHAPRHGGLRPLDPPFSHPRWPRVCRRFGSHSWLGLQGVDCSPFFKVSRGDTSCQGFAPRTPRFPTPVGLEFAKVSTCAVGKPQRAQRDRKSLRPLQ